MLIEIPFALMLVMALVIAGFTYTANCVLDRAIAKKRAANAAADLAEMEADTLAA